MDGLWAASAMAMSDNNLEHALDDHYRPPEYDGKPPAERESDMDWSRVISVCKEYVDQLANGEWPDENIEHYIFEEAMMAVYGREIWAWVNKRL